MIIFIKNKNTKFCQITLRIKDLFIKEKCFLFSAPRVYSTSGKRKEFDRTR